VARRIAKPLLFEEVWVVGLYEVGEEYAYGVAQLDLSIDNVPVWLVRIRTDFEGWTVARLQ
jgi:hypothetical protein